MSLKVFLSESLPEKKDNILLIISFNEKINFLNNILSTGTIALNVKNKYEIWEVQDKVIFTQQNDINISRSKEYMFGSAIIENTSSYEELKSNIEKKYNDFFNLAKKSNMQILKIWHYFPDLLKNYSNNKTNYSLLCDARETIYIETFENQNFPAATVIGIEGKKILIYFFSAFCKSYSALENKRQVSSYNYPKSIFKEKPMFSRAVSFIPNNYKKKKFLISGTASIIGYESIHLDNVIKQLEEALINYNNFIKPEDIILNVSRVYLSKKIEDSSVKIINKKLEDFFGLNKYILLQGEMCRKELLIEIEGFSDS